MVVPEEDCDTELLSDHSVLLEKYAELLYDAEELTDSEVEEEPVGIDVGDDDAVPALLHEGHALCVAVSVKVRL